MLCEVLPEPKALEIGTLGRLRVDVLEASQLVAADWSGTSDPYVTVKLGLFVKHTQVGESHIRAMYDSGSGVI